MRSGQVRARRVRDAVSVPAEISELNGLTIFQVAYRLRARVQYLLSQRQQPPPFIAPPNAIWTARRQSSVWYRRRTQAAANPTTEIQASCRPHRTPQRYQCASASVDSPPNGGMFLIPGANSAKSQLFPEVVRTRRASSDGQRAGRRLPWTREPFGFVVLPLDSVSTTAPLRLVIRVTAIPGSNVRHAHRVGSMIAPHVASRCPRSAI